MQKALYNLLNEKLNESSSPEEFAGKVIDVLKKTNIRLIDFREWLRCDGYNSLEEYFETNKEEVV